jgi:hypothetical protein
MRRGLAAWSSPLPAIRITFVNGAVRWILCDGKKPALQASAALLDTSTALAERESQDRGEPFTRAEIRRAKDDPTPVEEPRVQWLAQQGPKCSAAGLLTQERTRKRFARRKKRSGPTGRSSA